MNELLQNLIEALREELKQYGEMLALLDQQQQLAVSRKAAELLQSVPTVDEQSEAIHVARSERDQRFRDLARALNLAEDCGFNSLLASLPEDYQPLVSALVEENNQLLQRVQKRARQNHLLLSRAIELMQKFINTLNPGAMTAVYNETGRLHGGQTTANSIYQAIG